jgi:hypothetical protein
MSIRKYNQKKTPENEFEMELIYETCRKILSTSNYKYKIKSVLKDYINIPITRLLISSNKLFIIQLIVAQSLDLIKKFNMEVALEFIKIIYDEETRRSLNYKSKKPNKLDIDIVFNIVGEDKKKWIEDYINNYRTNKLNDMNNFKAHMKYYRSIIEYIFKNEGVTIPKMNDETDKVNKNKTEDINPESWTGELKELSLYAKELYSMILSTFKNYGMKNIINMFYLLEKDIRYDFSIESLLDTNEKKVIYTLQNYFHMDYSTRYNSIIDNKYCNPFEDELVKRSLKLVFIEVVKRGRYIRKHKIDEDYKDLELERRCMIFATTYDLYVAAGALFGAYIGVNITRFSNKLQTMRCPLAIDKIEMLLTGEFEGLRLFKDKDNNSWQPSNKNTFRLWKMNYDLLDANEWQELFDENNCTHSLNAWYCNELGNAQITINQGNEEIMKYL